MKPPITVAALTAADPARGVCVYHRALSHTWLTPDEAEKLAVQLTAAALTCRNALGPVSVQPSKAVTFADHSEAVAALRALPSSGAGSPAFIRGWAAIHHIWPSLHPDEPEGYADVDVRGGQKTAQARERACYLHQQGLLTDEEFYPSDAQHAALEQARGADFATPGVVAPDEEPFKTWVVKYNAEPANYTTTHVKLVEAWQPEEAVALTRDHLLRIGHDPARYVFQAAYEYRAPPPGKVL